MQTATGIQIIETTILSLKNEVYKLDVEATRLWRGSGGWSEEYEQVSKKLKESKRALLEIQKKHYKAINFNHPTIL